MILVVDDGSHSREVLEIPRMSYLLARCRNRDRLFQDGTKGSRIAQNKGILEITDDKTVGGEESFQDGRILPLLYAS